MYTLILGDKIKLEIRKQGINGEGIGYYNKLAIFVPGAILKEKVNCEIIEIHDGYSIARLDSIERPSTRRITPPCKYFDKCGGCQMQHIEYHEQLKIKQSILIQSLRRYTSVNENEIEIKKTLGMKESFNYRNKSQMPFKNTNFGLALGLYEANSNQFVYVDECMVQHAEVNKINKIVLSILIKHKVMAYDSINKEGILLNLVTRYLESTHSASVTFIVTKYDEILEVIAKDVITQLPYVKSITYSINRKSNPLMFGKSLKVLQGDSYIVDHFADLEIKISPDAFHQLNSKQMTILYDEVLKAANLTGNEVVIDCYSGIGITTLQLAKAAKIVYGIDYSASSVRDAIDNAKKNKIQNVEFFTEHVEGALPRLLLNGVVPDVVIFDPPRTGLDQSMIKELLKAKIKKMIYVSCNPSTLAKNLNDFSSVYNIEYIQPIDMFPHTASVESLTLLTFKK
ncbi:MAG: 23S rRNA (uracil(1939)-C(5))-methyltransferase RlmD [Firmicutes bacterium]|nr:23S rRNA (uracil(1939)-C(5))-methyltransferase RlmD [Bacillota bacterium]